MALRASPSQQDPAESLRRVDLFSQLSDADLAVLARALRPKHCDAGQVVVLRGDPGDSLYLIVSGRAHVTLTSPEGKEVVLTPLGRGDFFGDLALLDGQPRSADVIAREACELLVLQRPDFMAYLDAHAGVAKHLLAVMSRRLRRNADLIEEVAFLDIGARLARLLLSLADGAQPGGAPDVSLGRLNQTELANQVGATRESVNKCLASYQREGLVTWRGRELVIRDAAGLRQAAQL